MSAKFGIRLGISVERSIIKKCTTTTELIDTLISRSSDEIGKANKVFDADVIRREIASLDLELNRIIDERDWKMALRYVDGKQIATKIANTIGIRSSIDLMRSISANIQADNIPEIKPLRDLIKNVFSTK